MPHPEGLKAERLLCTNRLLPVIPLNMKKFDLACWATEERSVLSRLRSPGDIQTYLDTLRYSVDSFYRCPRRVLRDRIAHCADGAVFAAAALRNIGYKPLLVDLIAQRDDDHILAVFRGEYGWGAIAKSNTVGLRYREPIHRNLHELVLSYFEWYYNLKREKTLRTYSHPLDLSRFDRLNWMTDDKALDSIMEALEELPHKPLLPPAAIKGLRVVDERSFKGGLFGTRWEGLYGYKEN